LLLLIPLTLTLSHKGRGDSLEKRGEGALKFSSLDGRGLRGG